MSNDPRDEERFQRYESRLLEWEQRTKKLEGIVVGSVDNPEVTGMYPLLKRLDEEMHSSPHGLTWQLEELREKATKVEWWVRGAYFACGLAVAAAIMIAKYFGKEIKP